MRPTDPIQQTSHAVLVTDPVRASTFGQSQFNVSDRNEKTSRRCYAGCVPKIVTKGRLIAAMERGKAEGYNHQVDEASINALDPAHHYPVLSAIPHAHKHGERSERHLRILVEMQKRDGQREKLLIDIPEDWYDALPEGT